MPHQTKPDITQQISFIKDAIDIVTQGNTIVMDEKHATILREIAENLIAVRLWDQLELEKPEQEEQDTEPDYNGYSKHEEAERMHNIQRDLK